LVFQESLSIALAADLLISSISSFNAFMRGYNVRSSLILPNASAALFGSMYP